MNSVKKTAWRLGMVFCAMILTWFVASEIIYTRGKSWR